MADLLLSGLSNKPGATELLLASGDVPTGYKLMDGIDLGNEDFDRAYSGARGTQGAVLASTEAVNRQVFFPLMIEGTSQDDLTSKISNLKTLADGFRRFGGRVKWRPKGAAQYQFFIVLDGQANVEETGTLMHRNQRVRASLSLSCQPYLQGEPMDVLDDFSTDRLGEYTFDAGSRSDVALLSGELDAVATTHIRAIHTAYGYNYGDHQATVRAAPGASLGGFKAGVVLKRLDSLNYLEVYVEDNGANSYINIDKVVAGARTNVAQTIFGARVVDGTYFWCRGRIEGNVVYGEYFLNTVQPSPMGTATSTANYTLSTAEAAVFGGYTGTGTITGKAGWSWTPNHTNAKLDDFEVLPYTYRNATLPDDFSLRGSIPGDAPALCDLHTTHLGGTYAPVWALLGWWPRADIHSLVWNGGFEFIAAGLPKNWSAAAVTNINGASTSIDDTTAIAKYGLRAGELTCPATADTGTNFRIFRKFKRGVTYTAEAWIQSAAAVTNTYIRLGNGAANDKATSSNTALSTSWQRITVAWTPSADREDAHVAINIAAATATVMRIDGVLVYEGTTQPAKVDGMTGLPPAGVIEVDGFEGLSSTLTASATYRSGFAWVAGGSGVATANAKIDPTLLTPTSTTNDYTFQVWGRFAIPTGVTDLTVRIHAQTAGGTAGSVIYSEFGNAGRSATLTTGDTFRMVYLGTLTLPATTGPWELIARWNAASASGTGLDYLILVPATQNALSPSGKVYDANTYPSFTSAITEVRRIIASDLVGTADAPAADSHLLAAPGLGGSFLELPAGAVDTTVKLSGRVPDDTTVAAPPNEQLAHSATIHFKVTPRYSFARSS